MKLSEKGTFFEAGFKGRVKVNRIVDKDTRANGRAYIVEMTITATNDAAKNPIGQSRTWIQSLKDIDIGFRGVKGFCLAASGVDKKNPAHAELLADFEANCEEIMTQSVDPGVFNGSELALETGSHQTKGRNVLFTDHYWGPVPDEAKAASAA